MQIRFAAFVAIIMYWMSSVEGAKITSNCRKWQCQLGVGQGKTKEARPCSVSNYDKKNETVAVEDCNEVGYICDAPNDFIKNETCYGYGTLKWKRNMPAGDSCTSSDECFSKSCITTGGTKTCSGKDFNSTCTNDSECNPGLFCNSTKICDNVKKFNETCGVGVRCQFGTICANSVCTRYGTLDVGKQFYINGTGPGKIGEMVDATTMRVCKSFWAEKTGNQTADNNRYGIFECTNGRYLENGGYERALNESDTCAYNFTLADGTDYRVEEVASCGYNSEGTHFCPKRRSRNEYSSLNEADAGTWNTFTNVNCHVNSTIQYCRGIEDNSIYSIAYRLFLKNEMETQNYYPLIAKNDRCVGDSIETTKNYYRVIDSAYGTMITYFTLVAGFLSLVLLY